MKRVMRHALASHRKAVVLISLVVLVPLLIGGEDVVARYGATSMEIIVWQYTQGAVSSSVKIFDKTITNLDIVNNLQIQLDNCVPTASSGSDSHQCRMATRFALPH